MKLKKLHIKKRKEMSNFDANGGAKFLVWILNYPDLTFKYEYLLSTYLIDDENNFTFIFEQEGFDSIKKAIDEVEHKEALDIVFDIDIKDKFENDYKYIEYFDGIGNLVEYSSHLYTVAQEAMLRIKSQLIDK